MPSAFGFSYCSNSVIVFRFDHLQSDADGLENLSILAVNAINELLYRKYVPKDIDGHVNIVITFALNLLCKFKLSKEMGHGHKTVSNK